MTLGRASLLAVSIVWEQSGRQDPSPHEALYVY